MLVPREQAEGERLLGTKLHESYLIQKEILPSVGSQISESELRVLHLAIYHLLQFPLNLRILLSVSVHHICVQDVLVVPG